MGVWIMAGVAFREGARKKMLWMALAAGCAFLILYGTGLHFQAKGFAAHGMSPVLRRGKSLPALPGGPSDLDLLAGADRIHPHLVTTSRLDPRLPNHAASTNPLPRWAG